MQRSQQQVQVKEHPTPKVLGELCEFSTTQEHLARALRTLSGVAGKNPTLPILSHVLLKREQNQLRLSATDLEVGVTTWVPGKLSGSTALAVPLRPFAEYVQNLPSGAATLRIDRGSLTVATGRARATFQGETAENFPLIPHLAEGTEVPLSKPAARALDTVLYAMATEDTRPELAGVLVRVEGSTLTLAATDSYRLAEARVPLHNALPSPVNVVLPARGAHEFRRALEGVDGSVLRIGDEQLLLVTPLNQVVSRRIEGTYPDYAQIIPKKQPTIVETDRSELIRAIRASAVFSSSAVSRVSLEVGDATLRVTATTPEMGDTETSLPAEVQGGSVSVVFNERFLRDALGAIPGTRVQIDLGTATTPAMFRPVERAEAATDGLSVLALVMPIKT